MGDENPSGEPDHYAWKKMWGGGGRRRWGYLLMVWHPIQGRNNTPAHFTLYTNLLTLMCSSALSHLAFISADSSSPYMWVAFLAFISRCKVYYAALLAWFFSFWSEHIGQN